ncbi:MAG: radical SAM protein [Treponema sp.]|nr:radical SAM protein [Treponema sp.]
MGDFIKIRKEKEGEYVIFNSQNRQYHPFNSPKKPNIEEILEILGLSLGENKPEIIYCENMLPKNPDIKPSAPLIAYIEISNSCVLNCKHCFKSHIKYSNTLYTKKILSIIDDLEKMGCFELRFVGFEAINNKDFSCIVKYAKEKNFYLVLNTCAYFEPEKMKYITELEFNEVLVSLDGIKKTHDNIRKSGSYDRVINLLEYLYANKVKTRLNMTVFSDNIDEMQHIAEISKKYSLSVGFSPFRQIGNGNGNGNNLTSQKMKEIAEKTNELRIEYPEQNLMLAYHDFISDTISLHHPIWEGDVCPATKNISILNDGRVFFCDFLEYIGDKYCGGNIFEENINNIWQSSEGFQLYRSLKKTSRCYSCLHYINFKCSGGCASENLGEYDIYYDRLCYENQSQCEQELLANKSVNIYNECYYIEGKINGISNYNNYSWIPEKTIPEISELIKILKITNEHVIVDYGCAFGYYVKALRDMKYEAYGIDISEYAIKRAKEDESIINYICQSDDLHSLSLKNIDFIIAKDVLEH